MEMRQLNHNYRWIHFRYRLESSSPPRHLRKPSLFLATLHPSPIEIIQEQLAETIGNYYFELLPHRLI